MQPGDEHDGPSDITQSAMVTSAPTIGQQLPRVWSVPPASASLGLEAVELAAAAGLVLDPWEQFVVEQMLGQRPDGKWAAFEVGLCVARQNGKGAVLEARELAGLFLTGDRLMVHSAHQFDTSMEAFLRMEEILGGSEDLSRQVKSVSRSHGAEGFVLKTGQRLRYRTRTKGGGRGFSGETLILDEAMILAEMMIGALMPTLSAKSVHGNPQVVYAGSAVDQLIHDDGVVFARIRERGHRGGDPSLAYFEWSADGDDPDELGDDVLADEASWAQANPGLGIRISSEHVANELRSMSRRTFAVERLGVGDWPATDPSALSVIRAAQWADRKDAASEPGVPRVLSFDVTPARSRAAIGLAAPRATGGFHVAVLDHHAGTGWLKDRLAARVEELAPIDVVCDGVGPAASLIPELERAGIRVNPMKTTEHGRACGVLVDAVDRETIWHLGQPELDGAIAGATTRALGDAWAWSRKHSKSDISPLVAVTLALGRLASSPARAEPWAASW